MKLLIVLVTAVVDINAAAAFVAAFVAAVADGGVIAAAAYVAFVAAETNGLRLWFNLSHENEQQKSCFAKEMIKLLGSIL